MPRPIEPPASRPRSTPPLRARLAQALSRLASALGLDHPPFRQTWPDDPRIAASALLLDVAMVDARLDDAEHRLLHATVRSQFGLSGRRARRLLEAAGRARCPVVGLDRMTATIARSYSPAQKARLVEIMHSLAQADGEVSGEEGYRIRTLRFLVRAKRHPVLGGGLVGRGSVTVF